VEWVIKISWRAQLAAEKPDVFNAYQQTQTERAEKAMSKASHIVSLIGHKPGKAVFVGVYSRGEATPLNRIRVNLIVDLTGGPAVICAHAACPEGRVARHSVDAAHGMA
jgi:hypothetical protein